MLETPLSPPLIYQQPTYDFRLDDYQSHTRDSWTNYPHITGLGISVSGTCGQPNDVYHTGCIVCGKSYPAIKGEITLGYLESTHIQGETYETRMAKRNAFEAGMNAGSAVPSHARRRP